VLAEEGLETVDLSALPFAGAPLVARAPITHSLELAPGTRPEETGPQALEGGDPRGDLRTLARRPHTSPRRCSRVASRFFVSTVRSPRTAPSLRRSPTRVPVSLITLVTHVLPASMARVAASSLLARRRCWSPTSSPLSAYRAGWSSLAARPRAAPEVQPKASASRRPSCLRGPRRSSRPAAPLTTQPPRSSCAPCMRGIPARACRRRSAAPSLRCFAVSAGRLGPHFESWSDRPRTAQ
jgi:hypothetical protein